MTGDIIRLSDPLFDFAEEIARLRETRDRAAHILDRRIAKKGSPDWTGAMGEVSTALWCHLDPREHIKADRPDHGWEFVLRNRTISVKTRMERGDADGKYGDLIIPGDQGFSADYAVLVWPTSDSHAWEIKGYCDRQTFEKHRVWASHLHNPGWIVPHRELSLERRDRAAG